MNILHILLYLTAMKGVRYFEVIITTTRCNLVDIQIEANIQEEHIFILRRKQGYVCSRMGMEVQ